MSKGKWIVKLSGGEEESLTVNEMATLRKAMREGAKLVDFGDFGLGLSYIIKFWRHKEPKSTPLPNVKPSPDTKKKMEKLHEDAKRICRA